MIPLEVIHLGIIPDMFQEIPLEHSQENVLSNIEII